MGFLVDRLRRRLAEIHGAGLEAVAADFPEADKPTAAGRAGMLAGVNLGRTWGAAGVEAEDAESWIRVKFEDAEAAAQARQGVHRRLRRRGTLVTEHMIQPESPSGVAGTDCPLAATVPLPPHLARLWDLPTVAALGVHTYWRRPELTGIVDRSRRPRRWHRVLGAILGALWGASETWAGQVLLSPSRDVAISFRLPGRWWRLVARMLAVLMVFFLAGLLPSVVLSLVFEVNVVPALAVMGVVVALVTVALAWLDRRAHRGRGPKRVPGMVSITGLASHRGTAWGPSDFLREELLPWANEHNVGLYAPAASPVHARLYARLGFVPAPEHGPLAVIRPAGDSTSNRGGKTGRP